ncbi:serine/threonine-protein kinase PLK1-like [Lineus longissimus]|uniref:serine/threonine-protein kinase PLK1-like n=1 Tax=Lineus longissimus TaxID=88925 RepID=UPI002B4D9BC9
MLDKATKTVSAHVKEMIMADRGGKLGPNHIHANKVTAKTLTDHGCYITDPQTGITYLRGKLLGKGGFANCYELIDVKTKRIYAGKIVPKTRISKPHQKEKIAREIELHRNLKNKNIVEFHNFFEDDDNVYIVLEHCSKKSLVHILKNRKTLTEPEVRFYVKHLLEGCRYIHSQRIIHRDLKLGNMLLNDKMELKIADFGLATRVNFVGDKKMTVCGTPNYIAPEVLQKKGHSYEADMWAVGCIMFAMLVGRPPFETPTLKETYLRIATNKFFIPSNISDPARLLMRRILSPSPDTRPTIDEILADDFFSSGYMPQTLPTACCTSAPKFPVSYSTPQTPVSIVKETTFTDNVIETHHVLKETRYPTIRVAAPEEKIIMRPPPHVLQPAKTKENARECVRNGLDSRNGILAQGATTPDQENISPRDVHSSLNGLDTTPRCGSPGLAVKLHHRIGHCLDRSPTPSFNENPAPMTNPNVLWISKWVDYSNKYGFGFQLSNRSVGVLFNDTARISLGPDGKSAQYCDLTGRVTAFQVDAVPTGLQKRSTLLTYFATYMNENLIQGGDMEAEGADRYPGGIFMKKWFRTSKAIVMYLSSGTLQVNFFEDHTKIIMSTAIDGEYLLTLIDENRRATTYYLEDITQLGCDDVIRDRLVYSYGMLKNILDIEGEDI